MTKIPAALVSFALLFAAAPLHAQPAPADGPALSAAPPALSAAQPAAAPSPGERIDAILALRKTGGPAALAGLLEALSTEKHKGVRIQAVNALGFFNAPEALAKLRGIAGNDPDRDLRISAVMALARLDDTRTLAENFAVETDTNVKVGIIDALGRAAGGGPELEKIRAANKDAAIGKRLDFYARPEQRASGSSGAGGIVPRPKTGPKKKR